MRVRELALRFPAVERYALTQQILRSSRSVAANIAEAWRKRRYPRAFVARLSDAEAEAAETRCFLEFAAACGYCDREGAKRMDREYDRLIARLVRMIQQADRWAVGLRRPGTGPQSKPSPPTPSSPADAEGPDRPATSNQEQPPPVRQPKGQAPAPPSNRSAR